jgi:hypothetical protein
MQVPIPQASHQATQTGAHVMNADYYVERIKALWKDADARSDRNACGVVAVGIIADCTYAEAYATLQACGRRKSKGCYVSQLVAALKLFGITMESVRPRFGTPVKEALETYCRATDVGMVVMSGHVASYACGTIADSKDTLTAATLELYRIKEQLQRGTAS